MNSCTNHKNVLLVAHDAGGAEILAAWQRRHCGQFTIFHLLAGPALRVFRRDFGEIIISELSRLEEFGPEDFVLTGSSLESDLERMAIAAARKNRLRSVTFLDHWDLYRARFSSEANWHDHLPDEIWLGDDDAMQHALAEGFPIERLRRVDNPYFAEIIARGQQKTRSPSAAGKLAILFICEPFSLKLAATYGKETAQTFDDERTNLAAFLATAAAHHAIIEKITIRLHPRESQSKYEDLVVPKQLVIPIRFSSEPLLADDILRHDLVVGIESNALVIGLLLGRQVFSVITGKPWTISLPHWNIQRLQDHELMFHILGQSIYKEQS